MSETAAHDHELEVLEEDQTVPPRPEEQIADAREDVTDEGPSDPAATS
ncbi:hypothetical protein GCM10009868_30880 [Terrabacter aerolatus]|uniref:Uncharacterized protein n=1 Tax=Terrabacter aerolatus TaxID=422442 RepID=A0A512D2Z0_9MICO|nr:hypothetical protein [Terrabacter aerolatus]GEO30823.1 hypothetical protein TAE01_26330 [Terrabacter aerolatus]